MKADAHLHTDVATALSLSMTMVVLSALLREATRPGALRVLHETGRAFDQIVAAATGGEPRPYEPLAEVELHDVNGELVQLDGFDVYLSTLSTSPRPSSAIVPPRQPGGLRQTRHAYPRKAPHYRADDDYDTPELDDDA